MDKLERYRQIIYKIISAHAQYKSSYGDIENLPIWDFENDNYLLMSVGWNGIKRVHNVALHVRIREGKIWIEWDGIEEGITQELLDAGIPKEDIVLAFYHPSSRVHTGFAIA
ncbi:MAG TPA: XisI protein [Cyanobacteria bacterium UBA11369]|nr:XisI protein [Cyanobacteria bacterium UBA11371]HBE30715.1 XisI protein [Cyanobacteria bacterium UBA11368]HBE49369.1 XisI protein [Cyanobacteria bacterium UBA11369]